MKMTVKENINVNSVVLKHKVALEAATLLEGREKLLYTDYMLYVMISLVDNCIEENLINMINEDERDFTIFVEEIIEPKFLELIQNEELKDLFEEILAYIDDFKYKEEIRHTSAIGFLDYILDIIGEYDWEDLKFFFHHVADGVQSKLEKKQSTPKKMTREEFEGADEKMKALLQKFQKESENLKAQKENNGE